MDGDLRHDLILDPVTFACDVLDCAWPPPRHGKYDAPCAGRIQMDEVFEVPAQEFRTADPRLYPHPILGFGYGTPANVYDASHVTVLHASGDYGRLSGPSFFDAVLLRAMESVCADRERAVASCWRRRKLAAGSVFVDKPHNRVVVVYHHVDERCTDIHASHVYDVQNL
jgi:hypothetical protein